MIERKEMSAKTAVLTLAAAAAAPASAYSEEVLDAEMLSELGYYNLGGEEYERVLENFKQAIALKPSFRDARFGLAQVYDKQGQYQLAVSAFGRGLALPPSDPEHDADILILLGRAHHKLKQYAEALSAYRRAVGLRPKAEAFTDEAPLYGRAGESTIKLFRGLADTNFVSLRLP